MQKWFLRLLSAYDECLQVKNLCQPIPDMRHTDDAHLVALRPIWHAHISTCLVSAPRQWLTVYLHWYYSNRIVTYTGQTLHAVFVTVTLLYIISISSFKLHVRDKLIQFYRILYGARDNLTFFFLKQFLMFKQNWIIQQTVILCNNHILLPESSKYFILWHMGTAVDVVIAIFSNQIWDYRRIDIGHYSHGAQQKAGLFWFGLLC